MFRELGRASSPSFHSLGPDFIRPIAGRGHGDSRLRQRWRRADIAINNRSRLSCAASQ